MLIENLPDLTAPIVQGGTLLYRPFVPSAAYALAPSDVQLGAHADGAPALSLELVRGAIAGLPPEPFGTLDATLVLRFAFDDALRFVRARDGAATVARTPIRSGTIRMVLRGDLNDAPTELAQPLVVSWVGGGIARYVMHLSAASTTLLDGLFRRGAGTVAFDVRATLAIAGVAPRLPLRADVDPAALRSAIGGDTFAYDDLLLLLARDPIPGIAVRGDRGAATASDIAQVLVDWLVARCSAGTFSSDPKTGRAIVDLSPLGAAGAGSRFEWDVSTPIATTRPLQLTFSPLGSLAAGASAALVHATVVPPFVTGVLPVDLVANVPVPWRGVDVLGVDVAAPPSPPHRPQEVRAGFEFGPGASATRLMLRLSPAEPPQYTYQTYAIVVEDGKARRVENAAVAHAGSILGLGVDDFPVDFVDVAIAPELAAFADLAAHARWSVAGVPRTADIVVTADAPTATLALARGWTDGSLALELRERAGTRTIALPQRPLAPLHLELSGLTQYGMQTVTLTCDFAADAHPWAVELVAEGDENRADAAGLVFFTPQQTQHTWTYVPHTPFAPGYRFRPHAAAGPAAAWSDVRSAGDVLQLHAPAPAGALP